jgi:hypothetical protein
VATAAAALFGIGGGLLASRLVAMNERALIVDEERGDLLNDLRPQNV